jgi:GntR family transcriptional regulator/MocR family aminotransferase
MGYGPLREAIAEYLNTSRGARCSADQIAVVSGVQSALDLAARILLNPGDRVCMENPGYPGAAMVFESLGARISPVSVDAEGMQLPARSLHGTRLVYVTPGHQFPLGVTMSLRRRLALLEWSRDAGAFIFEDDYDSEYRYSGRPIPALQGLEPHAPVLLAGSFSKVLFPSLRLGYIVVPPQLVPAFEAALSITNRHAPLLDQVVLCEFITEGHFGRHLRRMRAIYAERWSQLMEAAHEKLNGLLEISNIEAGLQTVGWLRGNADSEAVTKAAAKAGVEVIPLTLYHRGLASRKGLQLGFAAINGHEIRRGVRDLAAVLKRL